MYGTINAKVINGHNGKAMPNVNISITDSTGNFLPINGINVGRISDKDGSFILPLAKEDVFVTFSFVGFDTFILPASNAVKMNVFKMKSKFNELPDTTVVNAKPQTAAPEKKKSNMMNYLLIGSAVLLAGALIYFLTKKK